jgi:hypothetical protein
MPLLDHRRSSLVGSHASLLAASRDDLDIDVGKNDSVTRIDPCRRVRVGDC